MNGQVLKISGIACALVLLLGSSAAAEPLATDPDYVLNSPCWDPDLAVSDFETVQACFGRALEEADAELNRVFQEQLDSVDPQWPLAEDYISVFRAAQRAWIAFRDADCDRIAVAARGAANLHIISCQEYHTRRRILELQAY